MSSLLQKNWGVKSFVDLDHFNGDHLVYVIGGEFFGHRLYKLGRTKALPNRLATIQNYVPFPVDLIAVIRSDDPPQLESALQKRFIDKAVWHDWFELDELDCDARKNIAKMICREIQS